MIKIPDAMLKDRLAERRGMKNFLFGKASPEQDSETAPNYRERNSQCLDAISSVESDEAGRMAALDELVRNNLNLVHKIARGFIGFGIPFEDLVAEGSIGLVRAAEKFNADTGNCFSTYATYWIRHAIQRACANQKGTIRIPVQSADNLRRIRTFSDSFKASNGRDPEIDEICSATGLSRRIVGRLRFAELHVESLNRHAFADSDTEIQAMIEDNSSPNPGKTLGDDEARELILGSIGRLDNRQRRIISLRFGFERDEPMSLEDISKEMGLSRERVRQLQNESLVTIKGILLAEFGCAEAAVGC